MIEQILDLLRSQNSGKLSAIYLANRLHASVPEVIKLLLSARAAGRIKSWGSGTPYMFYWSV